MWKVDKGEDKSTLDAFLERIPQKNRIKRVSNITPEEFETNYYNKNIPVIITDVAKSWPAYQKWTSEYLENKIGHFNHIFKYGSKQIKMQVSDYIQKAKQYAEANNNNKNNIEIKNIFPEIPDAHEKLPYIRHFGPLNEQVPELYNDISPTSLFTNPDSIYCRTFLFMGVPETKTNPHYDLSSNFVAIVSGTKHIALLPFGAEKHLNVTERQKQDLANSEAAPVHDPENLLLDSAKSIPSDAVLMHEHPVFKDAPELYYSPLRAGEMVFIPVKWFHYIHNVDFSVSVTIQTLKLDI